MRLAWRIVADTSCDLFTLENEQKDIEFKTVPFTIRVGTTEYIDDEKISVEEMLTANENHAELAQTACPSPEDWRAYFDTDKPVLAFTISSNLSGSYNSACTARNMILEEHPERKITVIDSKATGPETVLIIRKACEMIREGKPFENMEQALTETAEKTHIIFALSSYRNLIKAGRVSRLVGFIAGHLGFWGIGIGSDEGEIAMRGKARGQKSMVRLLVEEIGKIGLKDGQVVISHCQNESAAQELKKQLENAFANVKVTILPTRGLDSFYAERHGLIVGF